MPKKNVIRRFKTERHGNLALRVLRGKAGVKHSGEFLVVGHSSGAEYAGWKDHKWAQLAEKGWNVVRCRAEQLDAIVESLSEHRVAIGIGAGRQMHEFELPTFRIRDYQRSMREWAETEALDGPVEAHILRPPEQSDNGEVLLFTVPKGKLLQDYAIADFDQLRSAGYSCAVYNPLGCGRTPGLRNPEGDAAAIGSVVERLIKDGFRVNQITAVGFSLGSAAVCSAGAAYNLRPLCLVVPLDDIEAVARPGPIGSLVVPVLPVRSSPEVSHSSTITTTT